MSVPKMLTRPQQVGYQGVLLGTFALVATLLLVLGHAATREAIELRQREDLLSSLGAVIPAALHDNDLLAAPLTLTTADGSPLTLYRASRNGRVTAVAWERTGSGYAGAIRLLIGVSAAGDILGVRVLSHSETPGLGDKIEVARSDWILGFNGLSLTNTAPAQWAVTKDGGQFDAFSGATITPRAVVATLYQALQQFDRHRVALLTTPLPPNP